MRRLFYHKQPTKCYDSSSDSEDTAGSPSPPNTKNHQPDKSGNPSATVGHPTQTQPHGNKHIRRQSTVGSLKGANHGDSQFGTKQVMLMAGLLLYSVLGAAMFLLLERGAQQERQLKKLTALSVKKQWLIEKIAERFNETLHEKGDLLDNSSLDFTTTVHNLFTKNLTPPASAATEELFYFSGGNETSDLSDALNAIDIESQRNMSQSDNLQWNTMPQVDGDTNPIELLVIELNSIIDQYSAQLLLSHGWRQEIPWDFANSMLYTWTIVTTIGYGYIFPSTNYGKVATMIYALLGIPLMLMILTDLGKLLTRGQFHTVVFDLPIPVAVAIVVGWTFFCAAIQTIWETDWDYFVAFYFFFISLTTIGLGDIIPRKPKYLLMTFGNILIGLSLLSMCINVIHSALESTYREARPKTSAGGKHKNPTISSKPGANQSYWRSASAQQNSNNTETYGNSQAKVSRNVHRRHSHSPHVVENALSSHANIFLTGGLNLAKSGLVDKRLLQTQMKLPQTTFPKSVSFSPNTTKIIQYSELNPPKLVEENPIYETLNEMLKNEDSNVNGVWINQRKLNLMQDVSFYDNFEATAIEGTGQIITQSNAEIKLGNDKTGSQHLENKLVIKEVLI